MHLREAGGIDAAREAGISAVRDGGMRGNAEDPARIAAFSRQGLQIVSAGWALYRKGGYGSRFGIPCETREEILAEIGKLKDAGAAIIKVMASGMVSLRDPGSITPGGFRPEELRFIVAAAKDAGMGVMAHANGEQRIMDAAEAGVRSIEHGFFMTERALETLARNNVFWVPTVGALARAAEFPGNPGGSAGFVQRTIHDHQEMINRALSLGVRLAIGTDCVLPDPAYAKAYAAELAYFEQAGLSGEAVNRIACEDGASLLDL